MAANMQHMAGAGQMMPQQVRRPNNNQIQQMVYQNLVQNTPPPNSMGWQSNVTINDRMGKTLNLISNIALAMNIADYMKAAEFGCQFERDLFQKAPSKESYDQHMNNKTMEFLRKRQANEPNIQNSLHANAQAQAQAQAQQAQARAMMNLQAQIGRGMGQGPQAFQQFQQPMGGSQMPQQPQQQQPPQQQPQVQQQMAMGMANQAGRGMGPNQQMMNMAGGQNRQPQNFPTDMARLANADKVKVVELAARMMNQASEAQKNQTRLDLQQRLTPQQLAEFQSQGRDPLIWYYQNHALQTLRNNMNRFSQGAPNQNPAQATMMQPQQSQQSLARQNMMNGIQPDGSATDFSQFSSNMESIKDQQMNGLMAQQAGQVVVPASAAAGRNATPQPMNQNIPNQQGPNQTPRPQQPPQGQQQQQQGQQQQQQQQNMHMQQMKMNQNPQQPQLQIPGQMKQMQGQPVGMGGGIPPSQSPAMDTLNTPISRPPSNMNPMTAQNMGQGAAQFGDQRFNQGIQRPNSQVFNTMLANMSQEQRQQVAGLPPDKLNDVMRRWQKSRQEQMGMNAGQVNMMQNRPQNQPGQMNPNMHNLGAQGLQQPGALGNGAQPQMQVPRMPAQNPQTQAMMDIMDLPTQVISQISHLPPEVKKWRDLKMWLTQNNTLPQNIRSQLGALQQKQFSMLMAKRLSMQTQQQQQHQLQHQQPPANQVGNMTPGMPVQPGMVNNQPNGMARPMGNIPMSVLHVTPQEMMQVRNSKPSLAALPDEQLRQLIQQMKKTNWFNQQQQQLRGQAQGQPQGPQGGPNAMSIPQAPMQPQPNAAVPPQGQVPNPMAQAAAMQNTGQKQPGATPEQARRSQPPNNRAQGPTPSPAQPPKNLKRSTPDDVAEAAAAAAAAQKPAGQARPPSQPGQPMQKPIPRLNPQQIAALNPEQRNKYEQYIKMQMANKGLQGSNPNQATNESLARLRVIGQEVQRQFATEAMPDIMMSPQDHADTANKLQRIVQDMTNIGRGLSKWYALTRDDARAKMFFRTRLRIIKQFADGDATTILKDVFSIRPAELDQARAMLESMAKDLAASVMGRQAQNQQGTPQNQAAQLPQQQQGQPAGVNAADIEKDAQVVNKLGQQKPGVQAKDNQVPPAPTVARAPRFPFNATSPHGNPNYIGPEQNIELKLPPNKKLKAQGASAGRGATPSPQISKDVLSETRRASESQTLNKPIILCKEPDCEMSTQGFASEQALQSHIEEEHMKPRENPMQFVQQNLALALGLEPDGSLRKDQKAAVEVAPSMSATTSKPGQTPVHSVGTPASQDANMKRSASAMGKAQDGKAMVGKAGGTPKAMEIKPMDAPAPPASIDPWANSTIDPQSLLANLGFEKGIPNVINDLSAYRSLTPNDTPESIKDSGSSEPNSDISEGAALDIDVNWQNLDADLLLDLNNASLEGELSTLDATLDPMFLESSSLPPPDWDDVDIDFTKPFQLDTSFYSMATS